MCNPRRVEVTATRQVAQAWEREVRRTASRSASVTGEARIRQALDASVGAPALHALERVLEHGFPGWSAHGDGYRHDVEGGYVVYSPEDRVLEIVATASGVVEGRGEAVERVEGRFEGEVQATGEGGYYDDGYGGRTEEWGREQARLAAEAQLGAATQARLREVTEAAEAERAGTVQGEAERAAAADLARRGDELRAALEIAAAARVSGVGVRARQAFHRLLARAYRDVLLALARRRGAEVVTCDDSGDVLEIELLLRE